MKQKLICFSFLLILAGCSGEPEGSKTPLAKVDGDLLTLLEAEKATFLKFALVERDKGGTLLLPGRLIWNEEKTVRVLPQLGGRILRIEAEVGASVKFGQSLAVLSSPDYGQAQADFRKAQADSRFAAQSLARSRELREAGVVAEKDFQQAEAEAARAKAEVDRASRRIAGLGGDGDGSYALRSPLAGVVVERNINPGMEFRADQSAAPLFVITDPANLWIQLDASEADLAHLKPGEPLSIEVKQYPGERFSGQIKHVADFVDPSTRSIKVRGEVPNPDRRLKGEMFVQGLVGLPATDALRVPATAVFLAGNKRFVFVETGAGSYRRQLVEAGSEREGMIDIHAGVKEGEKVVTEGNLHLLKFFKPVSTAAKQPDKQAAK
jgi:cobalt-zinc-cadmium efflux system membrane fusion protein